MSTGGLRFDYADAEYRVVRQRTWDEIRGIGSWAAVKAAFPDWITLRDVIDATGTVTLPPATRGQPFTLELQVTGGTPPYTFALVDGELPNGLALVTVAGTIAGTPPEADIGTPTEIQTLTIRVTDHAGQTAELRFVLTVHDPPPAPPPPPLPPAPPPRLRLLIDGGPDLNLDELPLVHITELDLGYPEVREVADPRPLANGTIDQTRHFGARVVTLTGKVAIDWQAGRGLPRLRQAAMDALAPFLMPGARPWLLARFDDGRVRRILLRADQFSRPQIANVQDISLSFKSPTGILEDDEITEIRLVPEVEVDGRTYDLVFDRVYPWGSGTATIANNLGQVPADWTARIFGPCQAPAVVNVTTGEQVSLAGLSLGAGEFVEISSREHTVLADGLTTSSRWHTVDFAATAWWQLPAGQSYIRFRCGWWETPAEMIFQWRNAYLL